MNYKVLVYNTQKIMDNRQRMAVEKSQANFNLANKSNVFSNAYYSRNAIIPEIAMEKNNGEDATMLLKEYRAYSKILQLELKKIGLTEKDITADYFCKKCNDTGVYLGVKCQCYLDVEDKLKKRELNANQIGEIGLDNLTSNIFADNQRKSYEQLVAKMKSVVQKYPNMETKFLIFSGATGTGKSYLANAMIVDFAKLGFETLIISAFSLNKAFLKFHTTFDGSASNILDPVTDVEVLLIDDLGSEPHLNNVTNEYLISIINERTKKGKITLITTNLEANNFSMKYSPRIGSRLSDRGTAIIVQFAFDDLRLR